MDRSFILKLYPRLTCSEGSPQTLRVLSPKATVVAGKEAGRRSGPQPPVVAPGAARLTAQDTLRPLAFGGALPLILHARVTAGPGGGPDKTILRSPAYADRERLRMAAVYLHPRKDTGIDVLRRQAQSLGCPFYAIPERGPLDVQAVAALLRLCRQLRVTVWHAHDYKTDVLGLLLRRWWPMRLVTTLHGFTRETYRTRAYYHLDNLAIRRYEQVVAVSPPLVEHCQRLGIGHERLTYLPNGVDTEEFRRRHSMVEARAELGVAQDRFVVGVVGRLSVEKGPDRALELAARLRPVFPNVQMHFIGDGPMWNDLQQLAGVLGVADARFWGWQMGLQRFYEAMDVLLVPSRTEGLPNAVLEAMAMGVPVVATDVGGVCELLADGRCGVVLGEREEDWPGAIGPLIKEAGRREELADRAFQRVVAHYSFERRMGAEIAVYERVLRLARGPLGSELALREAA